MRTFIPVTQTLLVPLPPINVNPIATLFLPQFLGNHVLPLSSAINLDPLHPPPAPLPFLPLPAHHSLALHPTKYSFSPVLLYIPHQSPHYFIRVGHKGWDCKDDLKLFKYVDLKFNWRHLFWIKFVDGIINGLIMIINERNNFTGNHQNKNKNSLNFIQSSLKSHSLWVTL